jgi:hypothetical protein
MEHQSATASHVLALALVLVLINLSTPVRHAVWRCYLLLIALRSTNLESENFSPVRDFVQRRPSIAALKMEANTL